MNKKGVELFPIVIGLLLFAIIALTLFRLSKLSSDTTLERGFIARDIALLIETIYASPGDVSYAYDLKDYRFKLEIGDGFVSVSEKGDEKSYARYRYSAAVQSGKFSFTDAKELEIRKTGNFLRIIPLYREPGDNARDEFHRFAAFLSSLGEQKELCKSEFSFDQKRTSGYRIVYKKGELSLYMDSAGIDTEKAPIIAFAVHLPPEQAFDNFDVSVKEVAFLEAEGSGNFINGDVVILQKGRQLAFGQDRYSTIKPCTSESNERPEQAGAV